MLYAFIQRTHKRLANTISSQKIVYEPYTYYFLMFVIDIKTIITVFYIYKQLLFFVCVLNGIKQ